MLAAAFGFGVVIIFLFLSLGVLHLLSAFLFLAW